MRAYASILRTGWKKKKEGVLTWPGGGKVHYYLSPEALSFPPFRFLTVHDMKEGRKAAQPIFIKTCTAAAVKKRGGGDDSGGGGGNMCGTERWRHQLINISSLFELSSSSRCLNALNIDRPFYQID